MHRRVKMKRAIFPMIAVCISALFGFRAGEASAEEKAGWIRYIDKVCEERNICPELVQAVIEKESSWNPEARNGNCIGLMQINPEYQQERMEKYGITVADLTDPYNNILIGVDYLRELFEKYEDVYAVLMFYNAGYSNNYGLGAWKDGRYSDYAVEIAERSAELERMHGK